MIPDPEALVNELHNIKLLIFQERGLIGTWSGSREYIEEILKQVDIEAMRRLLAAHPEWAGRNDSGCLSRPTNVSDKMALTDKAIGIVRERAGLPDGWIPLSAEEGALSKLAIELVEKSLKSKEK